MRIVFLILFCPSLACSQCVSTKNARLRIGAGTIFTNVLECLNYGFTTFTKLQKKKFYWDYKTRVFSQGFSLRGKVSQVIEFSFLLCETVTESHCMSVTEGTMEDGEKTFGTITFSECQELCRVVTSCETATWRDNVCTIHRHSRYEKGRGTKVIRKDPNCKGRRPNVMRVHRNVDRGKPIHDVRGLSDCMLERSKRSYLLVDFDYREASCWYREYPPAERDYHQHPTVVEFVPHKDSQSEGEVKYDNQLTSTLTCGFDIPPRSMLSEESCRTLCSGVSNCIGYSYRGDLHLQKCVIHFFACPRKADSELSLHLVQFDGTMNNIPIRFACFTKTRRSLPSDNALELPSKSVAQHVASKLACAVACSERDACRGFTFTRNNQSGLCATSFNAAEEYKFKAC